MFERMHDSKTVLDGLLPTLFLKLWRGYTVLSYQYAVAGSFLLEQG